MKEYRILVIYSKELNRDIKIYISLPNNYEDSKKDFPVLYVTDGQVLFKDYDNYLGQSWGIMNTYMSKPNRKEVIIVGVSTNENRNDELLPFTFISKKDNIELGGKADQLMQFIIETLMPIINSKYRTKSSKEYTGLLGMSVGGVFSTYAATKYTSSFGRFASISSCYMPVYHKMIELLKESTFDAVIKYYFDIGTSETNDENVNNLYLDTNKKVYEILKEKIDKEKLQFNIIPDAKHEEEFWDKRFDDIIEYIF